MNMGKILVGCLCMLALASCNVKNSKEYKELKLQKDSLASVTDKEDAQMKDMMGIVNEVEDNFSQIREAEKYLNIQSKSKGELSTDTKSRIQGNFEMIQNILKKNRESLRVLSQKLKDSKGLGLGLRNTIELLNTQLEEKAMAIVELQKVLELRDSQIKKFKTNVEALSNNVQHLDVTVQQQDKALHTAYYMFGTAKELKEAKVVTGGFLVSDKIIKENIEANKFISIDVRKTQSINLYAKKVNILTDHPNDSYVLDKNKLGQIVLRITDYSRFWSLTKYLIVEVR